MSLFDLFRRGSAPIARERLQVLLSHERVACGRPDLLSILREEIIAVIGRHVSFEPDKVQIKDGSGQIRIDTRGRHRDSKSRPSVRCGPAVNSADTRHELL